jgi:hypothetical protein
MALFFFMNFSVIGPLMMQTSSVKSLSSCFTHPRD